MNQDKQLYGVSFVKAGLHNEDDFRVFLATDQTDAINQCEERFSPLIIKGVYLSLPFEGGEP